MPSLPALGQQHPLAQALTADPARARALVASDMVALSQSPDGRTSYTNVTAQNVIPGTDVAAYLPRETWAECKSEPQHSMHDADPDVDCLGASAGAVHGVTCPICLDSLEDGDIVSRFVCSHPMHFECANQWMTSRIRKGQAGTCPMCNFVVIAPVFGFSAANQTMGLIAEDSSASVPGRRRLAGVYTGLQGLPRRLFLRLSGFCDGGISQIRPGREEDESPNIPPNVPAARQEPAAIL